MQTFLCFQTLVPQIQPELAFSVLLDGGDYWNFLAADTRTFSAWTEALKFLYSHDSSGWLDAAPSVSGVLATPPTNTNSVGPSQSQSQSAAAEQSVSGGSGSGSGIGAGDVRHDLQALLELEMQLRLLDLDGVPLPESAYSEPLPVPPEPDDLLFAPPVESFI